MALRLVAARECRCFVDIDYDVDVRIDSCRSIATSFELIFGFMLRAVTYS
jgi:hypothetical protein